MPPSTASMSEMYFTRQPQSASRPQSTLFTYRGQTLSFMTDSGVFSKGEMDKGTALLLDSLPEQMQGDILDMGCGWGAIGVTLAKAFPMAHLTMVDINLRALDLARENLSRNGATGLCVESDGVSALHGKTFDYVVTNPPIRAGKQKLYTLLLDAGKSLNPGGMLYLVIRKQQGAESCIRFLGNVFTRVEKVARSAGFWIVCASEWKGENE